MKGQKLYGNVVLVLTNGFVVQIRCESHDKGLLVRQMAKAKTSYIKHYLKSEKRIKASHFMFVNKSTMPNYTITHDPFKSQYINGNPFIL